MPKDVLPERILQGIQLESIAGPWEGGRFWQCFGCSIHTTARANICGQVFSAWSDKRAFGRCVAQGFFGVKMDHSYEAPPSRLSVPRNNGSDHLTVTP